MSDWMRVPVKGTVVVHNTLSSAGAIDISKLGGLAIFFPTGFTAALEVWADNGSGTYHNTGITITPPVAMPTAAESAKEVDAAVFPYQTIKLKSAAADNTKSLVWQGKA